MNELLEPKTGLKAGYPFPLDFPFILEEADVPKLLTLLRKSEFRNTVSLSIAFEDDKPHDNKWKVVFYTASKEALQAFTKQIFSMMSIVWYG